MSDAYRISRNHLVRVIQTLHAHNFIKVSPGRKGGAMLARDAAEINLGEVLRRTEPNFRIVECFEPEHNTCPIASVCKLSGMLGQALQSFFAVLDRYTLADVARLPEGQRISTLLQINLPNVSAPNTVRG
jgi:Rrf2 family nitric oxide-sensitive transcriptional repressor